MAGNVDDPVSESASNGMLQFSTFIMPTTLIKSSCKLMFYLLFHSKQELEAIKARVREMEEEAQKLSEMNAEVEKQVDSVQNEYG